MTGNGRYSLKQEMDKSTISGDKNVHRVDCDNLSANIKSLQDEGFRLEMIVPADSPCAAIMSKGKARLRLEQTAPNIGRSAKVRGHNAWITGRAGMQYRDLIPGRLGGELIASHIRLTTEGEVPDYVHYHKVKFQMIYCVRGAIRVVYEDQGEPFWLHPGDCVLQPPEIRHRVLWAKAGSEVVELGMPAVHETWVEHKMTLPTAKISRNRRFSGQHFVRFIESESEPFRLPGSELEYRDTGIAAATNGIADVKIFHLDSATDAPVSIETPRNRHINFFYVLEGGAAAVLGENVVAELAVDDCFLAGAGSVINLKSSSGFKAFWVAI